VIKNAIILAGGTGSRLYPLTHVVNKHLLGVNGKFIIDYPIDTLKQMGVENLTVVLGGNHYAQVADHIKDGRAIGMKVNYVYQSEPKGIAQAIDLCQAYVANDERFVVILGDNIYGTPIKWNERCPTGAQIVLWDVGDLHRFGVASIDPLTEEIVNVEEKPIALLNNLHHYAITGCYLFDQKFFQYFKYLKTSARGEYEITDIIRFYLVEKSLHPTWASHHAVNGETFWSDAGTHESIRKCNQYFYGKPNGNT
jgi:glucose-1-phosphate thymidylyltransferase